MAEPPLSMDPASAGGEAQSPAVLRDDAGPREETGRHLSYLDGWRGIAVSLVVLGHFWADEHIWSGISALGVEFFFVLSGRLMAEILFVRCSPLPTFFARRFSRVYPALLAFVVLATAAFWYTSLRHGLLAAALALGLVLNYAIVYTHRTGVLDHLWSLCVEEHSYILFAIVAAIARRRRIRVSPVLATIAFLAAINGAIRIDLLGQDPARILWRSDVAALGIFLSGALWLRLRGARTPAWLSPAALIAMLICKMLPYDAIHMGLATLFLAVAVTTVDRSAEVMRALLSHPLVRRIGLWSYSIYLWQQPFYQMDRAHTAPPLLLLAGLLACALASFYLVEQPCRRAINRWVGLRRHAAQAAL